MDILIEAFKIRRFRRFNFPNFFRILSELCPNFLIIGKISLKSEVSKIRNKIQKGRCEKKKVSKCQEICKTYDKVQAACLDYLSEKEDIAEIQCNVLLDGLEEDAEYTTDFICKRTNGDLLVRECVYRKNLLRPSVALLLEKSQQFWFNRGVLDWQVVVEKEEAIEAE